MEFPETGSFESRVGLRGADIVRWVAGGLISHLATHPVGDQFNYSLSHLGNSERERKWKTVAFQFLRIGIQRIVNVAADERIPEQWPRA